MKSSSLFLIFIFICIFILRTTAAFAEQDVDVCESYPDVPVIITHHFEEPTYDYSHNILNLMQLAHQSSREAIVLGLTSYRSSVNNKLVTKKVDLSDGLSCAYVDHVEVDIVYSHVTVFIADEIPQSSCGFDEVMGHEQKHIKVDKQLIEEYSPIIEQQLKEYLKLNGVNREPNPDYAFALVHDKVQEILDKIKQDYMKENIRRQKEIDSFEEYRRLSLVCHGQLSGIAQRFRTTGQ